MARMQLIAGLVSVGLSILATLLAVDEIEVQVRRREAEPMERLQRAGVRGVAKLPGAARGSPGPLAGERSAARATGDIAAPTGGTSVRQKMGELPARPVANPEQPATLMVLIRQAHGGELAWESMRRDVQMQFNVTLAIMFPCLNGSRPTALHRLATYDWCFTPDPYDREALFDHVNCSTVVNPVTANPWGKPSTCAGTYAHVCIHGTHAHAHTQHTLTCVHAHTRESSSNRGPGRRVGQWYKSKA